MPTKPPPIPQDARKPLPTDSPWDKDVEAALPAPAAPSQGALKPPMWMGRPIANRAHEHDLEMEAAINEFGPKRLPRGHAEEKAYQDYIQRQHTEAAAHHLAGMRAAHAAGDMESARKHKVMYDIHSKALGHDPVGPTHPSVLAHLEGNPGKVRFKPHRGDLFAIQKPPQASFASAPSQLGKTLHALWEGLQALQKGNVLQFPGNPKPAQDLGVEAPVEQMIPVKQIAGGGQEHDYSHMLPPGWQKNGHRLVIQQAGNSPAVARIYNKDRQPLSSSSFYMPDRIGHRAGAVPDVILGRVEEALLHHRDRAAMKKGEVVGRIGNPKGAESQPESKAPGKSKTLGEPHYKDHSPSSCGSFHCPSCNRRMPSCRGGEGPDCDDCWSKKHDMDKGEMKAGKKQRPCVCPAYSHPHRPGGGKCDAK